MSGARRHAGLDLNQLLLRRVAAATHRVEAKLVSADRRQTPAHPTRSSTAAGMPNQAI